MRVRVLAAFGLGTILSLGAIGAASAQSMTDILPKGYTQDSFESDWLGPNNNPTDVCAGMVRRKYGNRQYAITATDESQRYREPTFRVDSQYQYRCTVLLKPEA